MSDEINKKDVIPAGPGIPDLPKEWSMKMSAKGSEALQMAIGMQRSRHGLYASIPMICRNEKCPYYETCPLAQVNMAPTGERCPLEIAKILHKFEEYSKELGIDEDNIVDMSLVKDLIDLDIQLIRAENKLAIDADFIQEIAMAVTHSGEVITSPQIHKAADYKERLMKKRHDVLQLLHSTRKDKAGDKLTIQMDPSSYAAQLMAQAQKMQQNGETIIDAEFSEEDDDDES